MSGSNTSLLRVQAGGVDEATVTATLRLTRLLVKHAAELKAELDEGFATTPALAWKGQQAKLRFLFAACLPLHVFLRSTSIHVYFVGVGERRFKHLVYCLGVACSEVAPCLLTLPSSGVCCLLCRNHSAAVFKIEPPGEPCPRHFV